MKLKPGDRVAVYGWDSNTMLAHLGDKATVSHPASNDSNFYWVKFDEGIKEQYEDVRVHQKQCRLLVKKPRRRLEVNINRNGEIRGCRFLPAGKPLGQFFRDNEDLEFVEVRRKK